VYGTTTHFVITPVALRPQGEEIHIAACLPMDSAPHLLLMLGNTEEYHFVFTPPYTFRYVKDIFILLRYRSPHQIACFKVTAQLHNLATRTAESRRMNTAQN
jgi:hypothetical protein